MKSRIYVFFTSLLLTLVIFGLGFMLSYGLDFLRVNEIVFVMQDHEINTQSYVLEQNFIDSFGGDKCQIMNSQIVELKKEIVNVGSDLTNYGGKSWFKKDDFNFLKRKYFLLELKFYGIIKELNAECGKIFVPIIFFYEIDDDISERQGFILDEVSQGFKDKVVVFSFDKDYDKEPALEIIKHEYDIKIAPTIIIDDLKIEGLSYVGPLNNSILDTYYDRGVDKYRGDINYVFEANGVDVDYYVKKLDFLLNNTNDSFSKADLLLVKGRLTNNNETICSSLQYYDNVSGESFKKALAYESIASIGCGRNKRAFYLEAANLWKILGNKFRANVDERLAYQMDIDFEYVDYELSGKLEYDYDAEKIILGDDYITIEDNVISQADRVTRDWLGMQYQNPYSNNILSLFSEKDTWNESELLPDIGWHEGGRIKDMGVSPDIAVGTLVKKLGNKWYASNLNGTFMFEVPKDKVLYPTTRFLRDDLAVIIDTHGINMLVERAELLNSSIIIGCCDHIGKIKAAKYLSDNGKKVVCFTDKYLPLVMNQGLNILGSPIIKNNVLGNQTIEITSEDKILVMDLDSEKHSISYYQTPTIYFNVFEQMYSNFDIDYFAISDFYEMNAFIEYARIVDANVIAVRVFNSDDYNNVKKWLDEEKSHRAILFHSASYPWGLKILQEYPTQTTFDDVNLG